MSVCTSGDYKTLDSDVCKIGSAVQKLIRFSQTSIFLGDDAELHVKIYASNRILGSIDDIENIKNIDLENLGEVRPVSKANADACLKDEIEYCHENADKYGKIYNGISFAARIKFNPHRVTFSRLKTEIGTFSEILEEAMFEMHQIATVTYANISYQINDRNHVQMYSQHGIGERMPSTPTIHLTEGDILKMGQYFFSTSEDTVWDSDDNV